MEAAARAVASQTILAGVGMAAVEARAAAMQAQARATLGLAGRALALPEATRATRALVGPAPEIPELVIRVLAGRTLARPEATMA